VYDERWRKNVAFAMKKYFSRLLKISDMVNSKFVYLQKKTDWYTHLIILVA